MARVTYFDRATKTLLNIEERMLRTGALPAGTILRLRANDAGFYVEYVRDGEMWRTSAVIGETARDAFRWIQGFASATFAITEAAYMTGEKLPSLFYSA